MMVVVGRRTCIKSSVLNAYSHCQVLSSVVFTVYMSAAILVMKLHDVIKQIHHRQKVPTHTIINLYVSTTTHYLIESMFDAYTAEDV